MPNKSKSNNNQPPQRQVIINAQYVKDLSFENPGSPQNLVGKGEAPKIDIAVDVKVSNLEANSYEVVLIISAHAQVNNKNLFVTELTYAGVFTLVVPQEELEPALMIYCPGMLFPFARRILSDATRDGGFPPLMLDPIDFAALYQQHKSRKAS